MTGLAPGAVSGLTCLIPAWNEAGRIGGVLGVVAAHPLLAEVIVIDDGSTDGTATIAAAYGARVMQSPATSARPARCSSASRRWRRAM